MRRIVLLITILPEFHGIVFTPARHDTDVCVMLSVSAYVGTSHGSDVFLQHPYTESSSRFFTIGWRYLRRAKVS